MEPRSQVLDLIQLIVSIAIYTLVAIYDSVSYTDAIFNSLL